jgi:hypothetical protein
MNNDFPQQPVLTSHLRQVGPQRGKQRFDVSNERRTPEVPRDRPERAERPRFNPRGPRQQRPQQPRQPKPVQFCHDQLLQAFKGTTILLQLSCGDEVTARLIDSDRYALVVENDTLGRRIVYKSALDSIALPTPKKDQVA